MPCAFCLALASAGNSIAARIAIIAITTRSSIKVKACPAPCRTVFVQTDVLLYGIGLLLFQVHQYSQPALLLSGEERDHANEEFSFCVKTALIDSNSVELRKDNPQSPALKKEPSPVVIVRNAIMGSGPVSYSMRGDRLYDNRTEAKGFLEEQSQPTETFHHATPAEHGCIWPTLQPRSSRGRLAKGTNYGGPRNSSRRCVGLDHCPFRLRERAQPIWMGDRPHCSRLP